MTLVKALVIGLLVAGLLGLSVVRLARAKTPSALLRLFGACCLIIVVLTHVAEALRINVTSWGVALSTCTATGRPWRSAIDIFVPLPRFVFPTQFRPFLAGAKVPSMNASRTSRSPSLWSASATRERMFFDTPDRTHC